jgi:hypothetical protein
MADVAEYQPLEVSEYGWVVERYIESQLHYWSGWPKSSGRDFTREHFNAIRFARERDAMMVLSHLCDGTGRVAQHGWISSATGNRTVRIAGTVREPSKQLNDGDNRERQA